MIKNINLKTIYLQYLLIINVIFIILTSDPFIFSKAFSDVTRYSAILCFFLFASLHSSFWKYKIQNLLFYLLFLTFLVLSATFSAGLNNGYLILIIKFFMFIVLVHLFSCVEGLGERLKGIFVCLTVCYALIAIVGFLCINYFGVFTEKIAIWGFFGNDDLNLTSIDCKGCVEISTGIFKDGYYYNFSKYFGFFAQFNLFSTDKLRYVGITFEPSLTALVFLVGIVLLDDLYWISISIRRAMLFILILGGFATFSLTFILIFFFYLAILAFLYLKKDIQKILFIFFVLTILFSVMFFKPVTVSSFSMRYTNIIDIINYIELNFTTIDYFLGKGALWFHKLHGINSGYLSIFSQFGILITLLFIILWYHSCRFRLKAQVLLFFCPFVLSLQTSILYMVLIALLLYRNDKNVNYSKGNYYENKFDKKNLSHP